MSEHKLSRTKKIEVRHGVEDSYLDLDYTGTVALDVEDGYEYTLVYLTPEEARAVAADLLRTADEVERA